MHGTGDPVVVGLHGAGASPPEVEGLLAGVGGTHVLPWSRGHGPTTSVPGRPVDFALLADDLRRVLAETGARRVLGVSLGAAAVVRLLAEEVDAGCPAPLDAAVLFAPAVLDEVPGHRLPEAARRVAALSEAVETDDRDAVVALLAADVPPAVRGAPQVEQALAVRAQDMLDGTLHRVLADLVGTVPVPPDLLAHLAATTTRCTVVAQDGDPLHRTAVARAYAAALPGARLEVFSEAEPLWEDAARLRRVIHEGLLDG